MPTGQLTAPSPCATQRPTTETHYTPQGPIQPFCAIAAKRGVPFPVVPSRWGFREPHVSSSPGRRVRRQQAGPTRKGAIASTSATKRQPGAESANSGRERTRATAAESLAGSPLSTKHKQSVKIRLNFGFKTKHRLKSYKNIHNIILCFHKKYGHIR